MKKLDWLADFAEAQKAKMAKSSAKKKVVASKKAVAQIQNSDMIIMPKSRLPKAVNGNTVKFKNCKWKVVNASYRDAKGAGVVLKRVAGVDTKKLTDPETRARNEQVDFGALDYNVQPVEEQKFQSEADATVQQIAQEDAQDRTTPAGRYAPQGGAVVPMGNADSAFADIDTTPTDMEMGTADEFGDDAIDMGAEDTEMPVSEDFDFSDEDVEGMDEFADDDMAEGEDDFADDIDVDGDIDDVEDEAPIEDVDEDFEADDIDVDVDEDEEEDENVVKARRRYKNRRRKASRRPRYKNRIIATMLRA